jgi:putative Mg2+ transporter-C (MgtC) family protein
MPKLPQDRYVQEILAPLLASETWLPLLGSLVTGILIGLDRELQGKPAGLRTHTLVCFASALLTLVAARQGDWGLDLLPGQQVVSDPTRMAHGILTGIGFLGAGVIFREGTSVQGLTTAASLWITAALGIVYGVGLFGLAMLGAVTTLVVLVGLRLLYGLLPRTVGLRLNLRVPAEAALDAASVRALLRAHGLADQPLSQSFDGSTGYVEYSTTTVSRSLSACDRLAQALRTHPEIQGFTMLLAEDAGLRESTG